MADKAKESVAEALGKMGLTYQYHVCAEEVGQGATVDSPDWKEPSSGAQAPIEPGTRRFLVRLRYAVLLQRRCRSVATRNATWRRALRSKASS